MRAKFYPLVLFLFILLAGQGAMAQSDSKERQETREAIFAAGCFWCIEKDMQSVEGVIEAVSGYTGGDLENPTYRNHPGHLEAVKVIYDPGAVNYEQLLDVFWRNHDPFDDGGQFCDRGSSYRPAIFVRDEQQRKLAEASKARAEKELGRETVTPIREARTFWKAEDYHQDYARNNPVRYKFYRWNCGRDQRLEEVWGKTDK